MKAVINTSPLIFIAKLEMLECLRIYDKIYTTNLVIDEIEKGLDKGYQEALLVKKLVDQDLLMVERCRIKREGFGLHPGELSIIELAKRLKIQEIIIDDKIAIQAAKYFGLKVISTPYLLLKNLKYGKIVLQEFKDAMDRLMTFGYFISPNLYIKILNKAEKMK